MRGIAQQTRDQQRPKVVFGCVCYKTYWLLTPPGLVFIPLWLAYPAAGSATEPQSSGMFVFLIVGWVLAVTSALCLIGLLTGAPRLEIWPDRIRLRNHIGIVRNVNLDHMGRPHLVAAPSDSLALAFIDRIREQVLIGADSSFSLTWMMADKTLLLDGLIGRSRSPSEIVETIERLRTPRDAEPIPEEAAYVVLNDHNLRHNRRFAFLLVFWIIGVAAIFVPLFLFEG
ncbi:hypothetical protein [Amaricoccus macauensis]|uniref:hypothetical protein n=1 Tax=Amaricoccus macauensis TaxID=57001 RepID=UPI003C7B34CB